MKFAASGKVILLGEHAVVYNKPCLAAGLARGVDAWVESTNQEATPALRLHVLPWKHDAFVGDGTDIGRALEALETTFPTVMGEPIHTNSIALRAEIHLPGAGGLGSSAALGVACVRAIANAWYERAPTVDETLALARAWELVFHGNPSGVDHTMATCGGAGVYTRGEPLSPLALRNTIHLAIGDTGERTPTKTMVDSVARRYEQKRDATEKILEAIAIVVRNGVLALKDNDLRSFGQLMDLNQTLLSSLMLSTERTEVLCATARREGALGAKLTGGGGGGCVIALTQTAAHTTSILNAWKADGAAGFAATIVPSQETYG